MIENKYYIPNIEEFHTGFEYYLFYDDGGCLLPHKIHPTFPMSINELEHLKEFRGIYIKYLDQEDIESLGYIVEQKPLESWHEGEYKVRNKDNTISFDFDCIDPSNPEINFNGVNFKIKNKSELIKLMKQLGIE